MLFYIFLLVFVIGIKESIIEELELRLLTCLIYVIKFDSYFGQRERTGQGKCLNNYILTSKFGETFKLYS